MAETNVFKIKDDHDDNGWGASTPLSSGKGNKNAELQIYRYTEH